MRKLFMGCIVFAFMTSGCFRWIKDEQGLYRPEIERHCVGNVCFLKTSEDIVQARCSKIQERKPGEKVPAWSWRKVTWDSGETCDPRVRPCVAACCVNRGAGKRFAIWYSNPASLVHELAHVHVFEKDGYVYVPEHHKKVHDFGQGKRKLSPESK